MPAPVKGTITLDPRAAEHALRAQVPALYKDPTDATVVVQRGQRRRTSRPRQRTAPASTWRRSPTAIPTAAEKGDNSVPRSRPSAAPVAPAITDKTAADTAARLNTMLSTIGFYVGTERTVPVEPATAASWITVTPDRQDR